MSIPRNCQGFAAGLYLLCGLGRSKSRDDISISDRNDTFDVVAKLEHLLVQPETYMSSFVHISRKASNVPSTTIAMITRKSYSRQSRRAHCLSIKIGIFDSKGMRRFQIAIVESCYNDTANTSCST